MTVIFEGQSYTAEVLNSHIDNKFVTLLNDGMAKVDYVGYYYDAKHNSPVYILPKVFCTGNMAFGNLTPQELIDWNLTDEQKMKLAGWDIKVLDNLPIWIYRAISVYNKRMKDNLISDEENYQNVISPKKSQEGSIMEIVLSLVELYKKDKDYFVFVYKESHRGQNKVNWRKTVTKTIPMVEGDNVIYMNPFNKKKVINFEEELLILFLSTIQYFIDWYGIPLRIEAPYELINRKVYEQYLKGQKGVKVLRRIKNNYFNDRMIEIWRKLMAWFMMSKNISSKGQYSDFLMARNFNIIFEDMVDELIGDKDLPKGLKEQKDGKIIDHLFRYESLIVKDEIYYIGDSKYYETYDDGEIHLGDNSIYKQFTYAKNVIQYNLNVLFGKEEKTNEGKFKYRDELTEGYNITPNFFIAGTVNSKDKYTKSRIDKVEFDKVKDKGLIEKFHNYHFKNRLFDRDTLLLQLYNINFLFVLYAYAGKNHSLIENFKKTTKNSFREGIRNYISSKFFFYRLNVKEELKDFVDKNFRMLNGKIFSFPLNDSTCLIMALQKCGIPVIDNFMVSDLKGQIPKNPTNDDIANENLNIVRMFHDIMYPYKLDGQGELKKENALSIPISNNVEMAAEPNPDGYKDKQNS